MEAWRLVKATRSNTAFNGYGAWRYGGRWNPEGYSVVYLSEHLSLAAIEAYVHLPEEARWMEFAAFRVSIPDDITPSTLSHLPHDWSVTPEPDSTRQIGQEWLDAGGSCLLSVPSVVVPQERNLMVNLSHPDWQRVSIGAPESFSFDYRLR
jgi:RES domain-containing protein